jgi:hypothetical protein
MKLAWSWIGLVFLAASGCGPAARPAPPPETVTVASPIQRADARRIEAAPAPAPASESEGDRPDALFSAALPGSFESDRAARAPVRIGAISVTGPRSAELSQQEILSRIPNLRACYENALVRAPRTGGSLRVKMVVIATGGVRSVQVVQKQASLDSQVADCTVRELTRMVFPKAVGGNVEIVFPVFFAPDAT